MWNESQGHLTNKIWKKAQKVSFGETYGCPIRNFAKTHTCTNLPNQEPTVSSPHPMG